MLIFSGLCRSFLIFSDLLRQAVRPSSTTLQPPSPLPTTPVTWEVVHGWTHEWTVVWIVGSIKALSAEGNKEMNGNDTSVNSTWITQHPNTCILQNHTVHVQAWMCNLCSDMSPCLLSPSQCILFFLRVLSMGGSLIFELDVDSRPCILMHLWKRRREKRTPAKHVP